MKSENHEIPATSSGSNAFAIKCIRPQVQAATFFKGTNFFLKQRQELCLSIKMKKRFYVQAGLMALEEIHGHVAPK